MLLRAEEVMPLEPLEVLVLALVAALHALQAPPLARKRPKYAA